jgi:type I restriction enzyme S subunit
MERSGFNLIEVGYLADVLWFGPFRRHFVDGPDVGVPFFSSSRMMLAKPDPETYISKALTKNLERLIVTEGTILISCSGTIGNTVPVTKDITGAALTQDAIRVIPRSDLSRGVLYAFLQSEAGQFLLTRGKSGGVVEHLYEADVSGLLIPVLPKALRREMASLLNRACELRTKANQLLDKAHEDVQRVP